MARAFGISSSTHKEGAAFDRDLQAVKAAERKSAYEEREREKEERAKTDAANREKLYQQLEAKKAEAFARVNEHRARQRDQGTCVLSCCVV